MAEEYKDKVEKVVSLLWLDVDEKGSFWNPDKDWDAETLAAVADVLEAHRPTRVERVAESLPKSKKIDVQQVIHVVATPEEDGDGCEIYTVGMAEFKQPEFEIRNIPSFLTAPACGILNNVCDYLLNGSGVKVKAGERMSVGRSVFQFIQSDNRTDKGPRLTVVDVEFQCQHPDHNETRN